MLGVRKPLNLAFASAAVLGRSLGWTETCPLPTKGSSHGGWMESLFCLARCTWLEKVVTSGRNNFQSKGHLIAKGCRKEGGRGLKTAECPSQSPILNPAALAKHPPSFLEPVTFFLAKRQVQSCAPKRPAPRPPGADLLHGRGRGGTRGHAWRRGARESLHGTSRGGTASAPPCARGAPGARSPPCAPSPPCAAPGDAAQDSAQQGRRGHAHPGLLGLAASEPRSPGAVRRFF
jgi:hypothetical protein